MASYYEVRRTLDVPPGRIHEPVGELRWYTQAFLGSVDLDAAEASFKAAVEVAKRETRLGYPCRVLFINRSDTSYTSWCAWAARLIDSSKEMGIVFYREPTEVALVTDEFGTSPGGTATERMHGWGCKLAGALYTRGRHEHGCTCRRDGFTIVEDGGS